MSAGKDSHATKVIYVQLLDEGTPVVRPTEGVPVGGGVCRLMPTAGYDPEDEQWMFPPGSIVRCGEEIWDGEKLLVAQELAELRQRGDV